MITLSPEAGRFVRGDLVTNLYSIRDRRRAMLAEAEACLTNKYLDAWRSESAALVDTLTEQLANDEKRIAVFEAAIPSLEKALGEEAAAHGELQRAQQARAVGSLKRAEALKLRDDLECAEQEAAIRKRAREALVTAIVGGLPGNNGIPEGPGRDTVDAIAMHCLRRRFPHHSYRGINPDSWKRWIEMSDADLTWLPLHAARRIKSTKEEIARTGMVQTSAGPIVDPRRDVVAMPIDDFVEEFSRFKAERAAHLRAKVAQAARELEAAKERAAALGV